MMTAQRFYERIGRAISDITNGFSLDEYQPYATIEDHIRNEHSWSLNRMIENQELTEEEAVKKMAADNYYISEYQRHCDDCRLTALFKAMVEDSRKSVIVKIAGMGVLATQRSIRSGDSIDVEKLIHKACAAYCLDGISEEVSDDEN